MASVFTARNRLCKLARHILPPECAFFASYADGHWAVYICAMPLTPDRTALVPALPNHAGLANVPGLRKLWLLEARYVLGLTDPRTVPLGTTSGWQLPPNGLQLAEDVAVVSLAFPSGRGDYDQKQSSTAQGDEYQQQLTLAVPKDHPQTAQAMRLMTGRRWVAVYQDANGLCRVVGTPRQPLRFQVQMKPNGYALTWTCRTPQPAPHLLDADLFSQVADFSYGFTYDFFS